MKRRLKDQFLNQDSYQFYINNGRKKTIKELMEQKEIESLIQAFLNSIKNYLFLERNLYPNSMLINVKILIPPSTGIQGGGQQGVPPGFPG